MAVLVTAVCGCFESPMLGGLEPVTTKVGSDTPTLSVLSLFGATCGVEGEELGVFAA